MPRTYVPKGLKRKYTEEEKEAALNCLDTVADGCIAKVVRLHNVPYNTLTGWIKNRDISLGPGGPPQLEKWVEQDLAEILVHLSQGGFPMDRRDLQDLVQDYVKVSKVKTSFRDGRPGGDWCRLFEKRWAHIVSRRKREGLNYKTFVVLGLVVSRP